MLPISFSISNPNIIAPNCDKMTEGNNIKDNCVKLDFIKDQSNRAFEMGFFTPKARVVFTSLRKAFIKVLIFYHFYPKYHI